MVIISLCKDYIVYTKICISILVRELTLYENKKMATRL